MIQSHIVKSKMQVNKHLLYSTQTPSGFYFLQSIKDHQFRIINCFFQCSCIGAKLKKKELTLKVQFARFFGMVCNYVAFTEIFH